MLISSTIDPNFEIGFVAPDTVAVFVPVTVVLSFPNDALTKLGSDTCWQTFRTVQYSGASAIHSAELRATPGSARDLEKVLAVVTSFIVSVKLPVVVEYFTVAEIVCPGLILIFVMFTEFDGYISYHAR